MYQLSSIHRVAVYGLLSTTSALLRSMPWPATSACSANAEMATSPFLSATTGLVCNNYPMEFYTTLITAIIKLIMRNNRDRCKISHLSQPITTYGSALTSSQGLAQSFHKDVVMYGFKAFHGDISLGLSTFPSFILLHFIHIYLILS